MPSDDPKFSCPNCKKQYRWKPELAGRSAKCACGAKLVVPAAAPAISKAAPKIATSKCPSCGKSLEAGAVLCIACGYNLKTGQKLSLVVEQVPDDDYGGNDSVAAGDKVDG